MASFYIVLYTGLQWGLLSIRRVMSYVSHTYGFVLLKHTLVTIVVCLCNELKNRWPITFPGWHSLAQPHDIK
jgi:putative copper export protein